MSIHKLQVKPKVHTFDDRFSGACFTLLTNLRKKLIGVIYLRTKVVLVKKKNIIRINWLAIS